METWNSLLPVKIVLEMKSIDLAGEEKESDTPDIVSKELLSSPKVPVPHGSNLRSVSADSIEGRSALNQYFRLFHENYVEYAHKVYYVLKKHHGAHLKRMIDDHHARVEEARQKILKVEPKQLILVERADHAAQLLNTLEERLERLRNLHQAHRTPLSEAERELKSEFDHFAGSELDALRSSIETLRARLRRYKQSSNNNILNKKTQMYRQSYVQDPRISQLRSTLEKLSLVNSENSKKVKALESALRSTEGSMS